MSSTLIACWYTGFGPVRDGSAGSRGATSQTKPSTNPSSATRMAAYAANQLTGPSSHGFSSQSIDVRERCSRPHMTAAVNAEAGLSTSVENVSANMGQSLSRPMAM